MKAIYESVTNSIIKDLEAGVAQWLRPWKVSGGGLMPRNYASKRPYSGVNVLILWDAQIKNGYHSSEWLTYKQAQAIGAQVKKGEKATRVVYTNKLKVGEGDEEKMVGYLKQFFVFNASQIDGLGPPIPQPPETDVTKFIQATGADIRYGGARAFYTSKGDFIQLPFTTDFDGIEHFYATATHELVHWTGAKHRLNRDLANRFGTKAYAAEELVAELGAAFLCAHLGVEGRLRHSEYIANWLELLREDDRAVFTAASKASQAADLLRSFSERLEDAA